MASEQEHRLLGNPFDELISPPGHRRAFMVPAAALRAGTNSLELQCAEGQAVEVVYIDVAVETTQQPAAAPAPSSAARALSASA